MPGVISLCPNPACGRAQVLIVGLRDCLLSRATYACDPETANLADMATALAARRIIADADDDEAVLLDFRRWRWARCACGDRVDLRDLGRLSRLIEV